jgi:hypothetical protein
VKHTQARTLSGTNLLMKWCDQIKAPGQENDVKGWRRIHDRCEIGNLPVSVDHLGTVKSNAWTLSRQRDEAG